MSRVLTWPVPFNINWLASLCRFFFLSLNSVSSAWLLEGFRTDSDYYCDGDTMWRNYTESANYMGPTQGRNLNSTCYIAIRKEPWFPQIYPDAIRSSHFRSRVDKTMSEAKSWPRDSALGVFKEIFNWYPSNYPSEERRSENVLHFGSNQDSNLPPGCYSN